MLYTQHCEHGIVQAWLGRGAGDLHGGGSWLPLPVGTRVKPGL